jgi:hypothetical protein
VDGRALMWWEKLLVIGFWLCGLAFMVGVILAGIL